MHEHERLAERILGRRHDKFGSELGPLEPKLKVSDPKLEVSDPNSLPGHIRAESLSCLAFLVAATPIFLRMRLPFGLHD